MSVLKEFKTFAMRGNVIDLAVGIIIGGSFGKIVSSFVGDVIMPPIGLLMGKTDFSKLSLVMQKAVIDPVTLKETAPAVALRYGAFINTIIDFVLVAAAIFMLVKVVNMAKKKEEAKPAAPPAPSSETLLLTEIRDLLKAR